jgi:hypothetical protein
MSFYEDLKTGQEKELKFIEIKGMQNYRRSVGNVKEYDIICYDVDNHEMKYEVKFDRLTSKTGNICIEFESRGKKSGVTTTEANFWVQYITDKEIYEIPIEDLHMLILDKKYKRIVKGGDNFTSSCYLFDKNIFSRYKLKI